MALYYLNCLFSPGLAQFDIIPPPKCAGPKSPLEMKSGHIRSGLVWLKQKRLSFGVWTLSHGTHVVWVCLHWRAAKFLLKVTVEAGCAVKTSQKRSHSINCLLATPGNFANPRQVISSPDTRAGGWIRVWGWGEVGPAQPIDWGSGGGGGGLPGRQTRAGSVVEEQAWGTVMAGEEQSFPIDFPRYLLPKR